ncbi:MAG: hypothetical protein LBU18_01980 [Treponema sp.]|nr:hypothetical protein [Treponema sp.]
MGKMVLLIKKSSAFALRLRCGMLLQKSGLPVGTVRVWGGKEYIKAGPGDWRLKRVAGKEPWDSSGRKAADLKISDFGTPDEVREMAKMSKTAASFAQAREILEDIVDKPLISRSGLSATLSKKSIKEILSGEATGRSFDLKAHLKALHFRMPFKDLFRYYAFYRCNYFCRTI